MLSATAALSLLRANEFAVSKFPQHVQVVVQVAHQRKLKGVPLEESLARA